MKSQARAPRQRSMGLGLMAFGVCLILAAGAGAVQLVSIYRNTIVQAQTPELQRRYVQWDRTYAFGTACASSLIGNGEVVLVNPYYAPGEVAPDSLPFDPDTSAFAYPLLPRVVTVQWDLSHPWTVPAEADYVAVWQQLGFRSAAERMAAQDELEMLAKSPANTTVCTYSDDAGDVGTVFAVSQRATAAVPPDSAAQAVSSMALSSPYESAGAILKAYFALFSLWVIGVLLLSALWRHGSRRFVVSWAFPLGCAAAVIQLATLSMLHISWQPGVVLAPWAVLAAVLVLLRRPWRQFYWLQPGGLAADERAAMSGIVLMALLVLVLAPLGLPIRDGFAAYFKAVAFWMSGSIVPLYQHAQGLFYIQPTHPPFVPLVLNWLSIFTGGIDEHATLVLAPAFVCSLWAMFYALARSVASRSIALWSTLAVAVCGFDLIYASAVDFGFADLPLGVLLLGGVGMLWLFDGAVGRWPRATLIIAALLFAGAAWSKEEGIVGGVLAIPLVSFLAWRSRSSCATWWHTPVVFGAAWLTFILPLVAIKLVFPAPSTILHGAGFDYVLQRMPVIVAGFAVRIMQHWFMPMAAGLLAFATLQRRSLYRNTRFWLPALFVLAQLGADMVAIGFNPTEVHDEITGAAGRLLTQLTPLVYLAAVTLSATPLLNFRSQLLRRWRRLNTSATTEQPSAAAPYVTISGAHHDYGQSRFSG